MNIEYYHKNISYAVSATRDSYRRGNFAGDPDLAVEYESWAIITPTNILKYSYVIRQEGLKIKECGSNMIIVDGMKHAGYSRTALEV